MYKLTTYTTNDKGRKTFKEFEDTSRTRVNAQADRYYGRRKYEFDNCKQIVRKCATSSEVADIIKTAF